MLKAIKMATLCSILSGCTYSGIDSTYTGPKPHLETFAYQPQPLNYHKTLVDSKKKFDLYHIGIESKQNLFDFDHSIHIDFYQNKNRESPLILCLPMAGGENELSNIFCKYFVKKGFHAAIIHRQESYKSVDNIKHLNRNLGQMILDHKQALDYFTTKEKINDIGLFGISLGSIKGALVSAHDSRIDASVLCLTGGDIPHILSHSSLKEVQIEKERYMKNENLSLSDLETKLKETITLDPIHVASSIDAENTLLILAAFDTVVPYKNGIALKEKIGNPHCYTFFVGHFSSLVALPVVKHISKDFFEEKLKQEKIETASQPGLTKK